ncbi:MAG: DUF423 domain-containing protein [Flavobacteriaceae bacterium]
MNKNLSIATLLGLTAIIIGAFATHALKEKLTPEALSSIDTAVRYQMYHVIVLLFVNTYKEFEPSLRNRISLFFIVGILSFSGSIYTIYLLNVPAKSIWFITPLGGLFLMMGWLRMLIFFLKKVINKK